ncbi:hypothetical protein [Moraxella lacunata]
MFINHTNPVHNLISIKQNKDKLQVFYGSSVICNKITCNTTHAQ